jgi:hypothetical protein
MIKRWIVTYYNGDDYKAAMIHDDSEDGTVNMPFGVQPEQVADDCEDIISIVGPFDLGERPTVVIDDEEFDLSPDSDGVDEEEVPPADEDEQD